MEIDMFYTGLVKLIVEPCCWNRCKALMGKQYCHSSANYRRGLMRQGLLF
jgi:hypothetical protein